jgi:hypothetical protein
MSMMLRSSRVVCALCLGVLVLVGCGRSVSRDDVPGTYRADDYPFDRTEVLVLRADGTFEETFTSEAGASYANGGRWHAEVDGGKVTVVLDNAIVYSLLEPPLKQEWRLKARRGLRGGLSLYATEGDPDGIIELRKTE